MHREGAHRRLTGGAQEQVSGEGDYSERFRPQSPPSHPTPPPTQETLVPDRPGRSNRAAELASNWVHARRQKQDAANFQGALAGSEVVYSLGGR